MVPCGLEAKWKDKAPKKYSAKGNPEKQLLNECLGEHVVQYALIMDVETCTRSRQKRSQATGQSGSTQGVTTNVKRQKRSRFH